MKKEKTRSMDSRSPLNSGAQCKSGEDKSGVTQKDWTREDRGSTEYEKHR